MMKDVANQQVADFWIGDGPDRGRLKLFRILAILGAAVSCTHASIFAFYGKHSIVPYIVFPYFLPLMIALAMTYTRSRKRTPILTFFYLITVDIATRFVADPGYLIDVITFGAFVAGCYAILKARVALILTIYHAVGLIAVTLIVKYFSPFTIIYRNDEGFFSFAVAAFATAIVVWVMMHIQSRNAEGYFNNLQEKVLEVMQLNQDQRLLLGVVLHDFSNDLMRAMWISERLQADERDNDLPDRLNLALNSMADLIGQLKKLRQSSIEGAGSEPVRIGDVIDRAALGFRDLLKQNRVQLQVSGDQELQVKVPMIIMSASIFNNLISNAIKFSSPGNSVKISIRKRGGLVGITIVNVGPPTDEQNFRAAIAGGTGHGEVSHADKGQNLGLLIASRFCERMGIDIWGEQVPTSAGLVSTTLQLQIPEWSHES